MSETDLLEQGEGPLTTLCGRHPDVGTGKLHILHGSLGGEQVIALKNETEEAATRLGSFIRLQSGNVAAIELEAPLGRRVHEAEDVHKGRFART
jgi:hypothetical protein